MATARRMAAAGALVALAAAASMSTAPVEARALVSATAPSLYDYKYDGKTTYCYSVDQGMDVQNLDFAYVRIQASGSDCPLTLTISRSAGAGETLLPMANTEFVFTATLNLGSNAFNLKALTTYVPDPVTFRPVQIGHANVHTCARTTVCDVFRTGSLRKITTQETSNFTGDSATFYQKLAFDGAGDYNVFAHVIIPPANPQNSSYHFIAFTTTTVASVDDSSTSSGGMSTAAVVGLVLGAVALVVAVVLAVVFCKRKAPGPPGDDLFRSSGGGFMPTLTTKHHSRLGGASSGPGASDWLHAHELGGDLALKDTYRSGRSDFRQPPGLSASALAFHERASSRQPKTASSSGSFRASLPRVQGFDAGFDAGYGDFSTPAAAPSGRGGTGATGTNGAYYGVGGGAAAAGGFRHGDPDAFRIPSAIIKSFESDNSMGTSLGFNADSHYAPYGGGERESDLSSIHADDDDDGFARGRGHTQEALGTLDEGRLSDISMATVDFTLHRPQPPRAAPYQPPDLDRASIGTADFHATSRSTEVFDLHDSNYQRPQPAGGFVGAGGAVSGASRGHGGVGGIAPSAPPVDPRDGRALSDGESYEF